jgi:hypothetical protein
MVTLAPQADLTSHVSVHWLKSQAGKRAVVLLRIALEALRAHSANLEFMSANLEAIIFTGAKGALLRSGRFPHGDEVVSDPSRAELPDRLHVP